MRTTTRNKLDVSLFCVSLNCKTETIVINDDRDMFFALYHCYSKSTLRFFVEGCSCYYRETPTRGMSSLYLQ